MDGGVDVTAVDKQGRTARDLAVESSRKYAIEMFNGKTTHWFPFLLGRFY